MSTPGRTRSAAAASAARPHSDDRGPWVVAAGAPVVADDWERREWLDAEQYARRIAREVARTWRRMELIWPGTDFSGLLPMVVHRGGLVLIRTGGGVTHQPLNDFDQGSLLNGRFLNFGFTHFHGANAPWVEVPEGPLDGLRLTGEYRAFPRASVGFALLTHQSFRHYVQAGWKDLGRPPLRLERYPPDLEARRRRVEMWLGLRRALLEPEEQDRHLAMAAFWYQEWKSRNSDEVAQIIDAEVRDSTAHFVDECATARAALGIDAPPSTLDRAFRRLVELDFEVTSVYEGTVGSEASHAGALACMLLHRIGHPMWQWDAEDGVPPLESLLGVRTGTPRRAGAEAEAILDRVVRPRQRLIRRPMEQLLRRLATRGAFFLVFEGLPASDGAFRSSGGYRVEGFPGVVFLPSVSGRFRLGDGRVSLQGATLVAGLAGTACGSGEAAMALPIPEAHGPFGDRLTFRTDDCEVDVSIDRVEADHEGRILLCATTPSSARPRR